MPRAGPTHVPTVLGGSLGSATGAPTRARRHPRRRRPPDRYKGFFLCRSHIRLTGTHAERAPDRYVGSFHPTVLGGSLGSATGAPTRTRRHPRRRRPPDRYKGFFLCRSHIRLTGTRAERAPDWYKGSSHSLERFRWLSFVVAVKAGTRSRRIWRNAGPGAQRAADRLRGPFGRISGRPPRPLAIHGRHPCAASVREQPGRGSTGDVSGSVSRYDIISNGYGNRCLLPSTLAPIQRRAFIPPIM